jgi:hypothetical protein
MTLDVTAERVKKMREETGLGMQDCRAILEREERQRELHALETEIQTRNGDHSDLLRVVAILKEMNQ